MSASAYKWGWQRVLTEVRTAAPGRAQTSAIRAALGYLESWDQVRELQSVLGERDPDRVPISLSTIISEACGCRHSVLGERDE